MVDSGACTRCLADEPHPWHDDGTANDDERYEPGGQFAPPTHLKEDNEQG